MNNDQKSQPAGEASPAFGCWDQMSNAELAEAINVAHEKQRNTIPDSPKMHLWQNHLAALLEVQRSRAMSFVINPNADLERTARSDGTLQDFVGQGGSNV